MKTAEIRQAFLDFFRQRQHTIVPTSSLVPGNDPSLLFTNAGMVQFKETFLGLESRDYNRAVSVQRCVRAGGKHNDLDNVGYTARHHTFFEMLGNFSFGDYFKREAIQMAWSFLTEVLQLPEDKLWVTVYKDDHEAADIWLNELKVSEDRFSRCGDADNFWSMGDTGPCGPCSEIFYDHGADIPGGPPGSPDQEGDRYIEIWNLVFMQYDRSKQGELSALPKPSVDTGMGLERIAAVMQKVHNNYDIDLFQALIKKIAELAACEDTSHNSLKVIADHIRSSAFLIADGVMPSNEGRGYVLRRIIRRAIRHGHQVGFTDAFFHQLVGTLDQQMGVAYPELHGAKASIEKILLKEEQQFAKTLEQGLKIFKESIADLKSQEIPGEVIFKLYDTYGFPADLTADMAREQGLTCDMPGFEEAMAGQRRRAKSASKFDGEYFTAQMLDETSAFHGYDTLTIDSVITRVLPGDTLTGIVLQDTPFYAESGGQVGDIGLIYNSELQFRVTDTQKQGKAIVHYGECLKGLVQQGQAVTANVDATYRRALQLNHSATHLLHAALRQELGEHVAQKGSLVAADKLRFDFTHFEALTPQQLSMIEQLVNNAIRENYTVQTDMMSPENAKASGAMALFGEKYGDTVRVLSMGDFSKELCGGTHVKHTGDIGLCKITGETGIASGIRRIEAITGMAAIKAMQQLDTELTDIAKLVKTNRSDVIIKVKALMSELKQLEKSNQGLAQQLTHSASKDLAQHATRIADINVLAKRLDGTDPKSLRDTLDKVKNQLGDAVIVLAAVNNGRLNVIAGVSKNCLSRVPPASEYVKLICGRGGGRPDMAQGGGDVPEDLAERLQQVVHTIEQALVV